MAQQQCPFCQLVANPDQTFDVHESENFKAWLDINPRARGHTMVVPKEHSTSLEELEDAGEFFEVVMAVAGKARNALGASGVSIVMNEGEAAGQQLEHFYAQVFPRYEGEENEGAPAGAIFQPLEEMDESDLKEIAGEMSSASAGEDSRGPAAEMLDRKRLGDEDKDEEGGTDGEEDKGSEGDWDDDPAEFR